MWYPSACPGHSLYKWPLYRAACQLALLLRCVAPSEAGNLSPLSIQFKVTLFYTGLEVVWISNGCRFPMSKGRVVRVAMKWAPYNSLIAFFVAFAKLEKRLLNSSCLCVCVCVCVCVRARARACVFPHGTTGLPMDGFSWNLIFEDFSKICWENLSFIKIWQ
jgi:hypothetical protein